MIGAREEGKEEGMRAMLLELVEFKFHEIPEWASNAINTIPPNEITMMMTQAVTANTLEEWLKP